MPLTFHRGASSYSSVEGDLIAKYGQESYENIRQTSRLEEVLYCVSDLVDKGAEHRPPPRTQLGSVYANHDFLILEMCSRGKDSDHEDGAFTFYIKAGKVGYGARGTAGVYVHLLGEDEIGRIDDWRHQGYLVRWKCGSIQVPLDNLVQILEDQDPVPNYSDLALLWLNMALRLCCVYAKRVCKTVPLLSRIQALQVPGLDNPTELLQVRNLIHDYANRSGWVYAQAACKRVLLFLSEQPTLSLPHGHSSKLYWKSEANMVQATVDYNTRLSYGLATTASDIGHSMHGRQIHRSTVSLQGRKKIAEQPQPEPFMLGFSEIKALRRRTNISVKPEMFSGCATKAHTENVALYGETPSTSCKLEDVTTDPVGQSTEAFEFSAEAESVPVNLMDWNSTPRELQIVASNASLRRDALAHGFTSFHHEFDPERVLCIYSVTEDFVEILFFHEEGMAIFFGVGLSFSRVLLRKERVKDGVVEVRALQQQVWMNRWSESQMANFSLHLFESSMLSAQAGRFDSAPRSTVQSFSPEQAAEEFGVGLGDDSYNIRVSEFQEDVSDVDTAISPSWIASLYEFLSCKGHAGNDNQDKDMGSGYNQGKLPTTTNLSRSVPPSVGIGQGTTPEEDPQRSQGPELSEVTAIERGMQNQPLQLTVVIYLDPQDRTFFFGPHNATPADRAAGEMRLDDPESSTPMFVHCQRGEALSIDVDPLFRRFPMVPEVTIKFIYDPRFGGSGSKKMTTTLDVNFLMEGTVSDDPNKFGWYHDQLRLSFECKRPNEVRRVPRETEFEILSKHEVRTADKVHARGNSTSALRGRGRTNQISAGIGNIAAVQMGNSSSQESTVGSNENQELSSRISAVCLGGANFSIRKVEGYSELAYVATTFPRFHQYRAWNLDDRELANASGMMSAVRIQIKGDWEVTEDDDNLYSANSAAASGRDFCQYDFSCQRELKLLRLSKIGRVNVPTPPFFRSSRDPEPEMITEARETSTTVQEKLVRRFLVNHRFSHMKGLERPQPYRWNMIGRPQAPPPAPAILNTEPQQWQSFRI